MQEERAGRRRDRDTPQIFWGYQITPKIGVARARETEMALKVPGLASLGCIPGALPSTATTRAHSSSFREIEMAKPSWWLRGTWQRLLMLWSHVGIH